MSIPSPQDGKKQKLQYTLLAALVLFALALCVLVVIMMLLRGPAVAY